MALVIARWAVIVAPFLFALGTVGAVKWANGAEPSATFDVVIGPAEHASAVPIDVTAARFVEIDAAGALIVRRDSAVERYPRPQAYQTIEGAQRAVDVRFEITPAGHVQFAFGAYDQSRPLYISHPVPKDK
jgi:hypothetical protein